MKSIDLGDHDLYFMNSLNKPLGKADLVGLVFCLGQKKPEFVCNEAISETCGDDFYWPLRAVFTHVVL
jgi:hypothetical protein